MSEAVQLLQSAPPRPDREMTGPIEHGLSRLVKIGLAAIAALVLGFGTLIAFLPMAGAVIAQGEVTVETQVKEISHPFGGVAADILVENGSRVKKGQVLIRLDSKVSGAAARFTGLSLDQLLAREARLRSIQSGAEAVRFPAELQARASDPQIAAILEDERRSFRLARSAQIDQVRQLSQRIAQARAEIAAQESRARAYARQEDLVGEELVQTRQLYQDRLTTLDRLNALERAAVGVGADRASAQSGAAEGRARIGEYQAQMASVGSDARSRAAIELGEVRNMIAELRKESAAATYQNDRTAIRAPQDGVVDKLTIRTIGSVVPAGQTLMEIVPIRDKLVVKAHVRPTDIDQVAEGQEAHLRFTALNMRTTPELGGTVVHLAADSTVDQTTNIAFYPATISIPDAELRQLGRARLSVGMPVEVFIQTGERTILEYILRPLADQMKRALRE